MDRVEAKKVAEKELEVYRALPYEQIARKVGNAEGYERVKENGERYQIEFIFVYNDVVSKNIRVMAAVSYSGWTNFFPVSNDFIMAPDGKFIGE